MVFKDHDATFLKSSDNPTIQLAFQNPSYVFIRNEFNNWRPHRLLGNITPREFARRVIKKRRGDIASSLKF
jgi:hypothetical protein